MNKYVEVLGCASAPRAANSALSIVGADNPLFESGAPQMETKEVVLGVGGAAAGAYFWKKHPYLGAMAGLAVGSAVVPVMRDYGNDRRDAMYRLGIEGAAIGAALYFKKHPFLGYVGGLVGASLVSTYVSGSPMNRLAARLERAKTRRPLAA